MTLSYSEPLGGIFDIMYPINMFYEEISCLVVLIYLAPSVGTLTLKERETPARMMTPTKTERRTMDEELCR